MVGSNSNSILARKAGKSKPLIAPAFGTTSITPFFSSPSYGSIQSPFGVQNSKFGFQSTPTCVGPGFQQTPIGRHHGGSRVAPYTATDWTDDVGSVKLLSISAIPEYKDKSHEEIRWEDYQLGDEGGLFPRPTQSSRFGQTTSAFGHTGTSSFGQTTFAFGQASPANLSSGFFGSRSKGFDNTPFGSSSGAAFNSPFGATSLSNSFGTVSSSPSLFGSPKLDFGWASSASPFGTSSSSAFGSTPFGQASQPGSCFGLTPSLGSSPAFVCNTSFGNSQSGSFKFPTHAFGQTATVFGQTTPAFGQTTNVFGQITPAFGSNFFSNSTASMMFQSKLEGHTQSQPSAFGGFQNHAPTQTQGASFSFDFGQPQPTEMEASKIQTSKAALGKHTGEVEKENTESSIPLILQRMDKDKENMEQLKEKVEQLTSYVENLVGAIQSSALMPTLPLVNVAEKDMQPAGEIGCIVKATVSWMEELVSLGSKLVDEAVILYHKIQDELNILADMNKKFDEELQRLEWSLPQIKEMMKIDFDILVAEEIFDRSGSSLPIEWLKATEWRIKILEEGIIVFKEVEGIAHDALADIQDFIVKIPSDFYDDQRSINSAGVIKDQLAKFIKELSSILDIAAIDRLMKLKTLSRKFEKKLIKCREVPSKVSNIHISQDMRFRYSKGPNQESVKEAIDKFNQYQKRVCNNEKGTINSEDKEKALSEGT